ncbi:MAG TPA: CPBP family intramembrane glutamic endopeptidase [Rhizomicrobium sp.]|nr:CPBP family intramembrane glutamic endopeptidase [Rhizomicrobium sp.]
MIPLSQLLMLVGLLGPFASALAFLRRDAILWRDFKDRLVNWRRLRWRYLPVTILLMPLAAYAAIWLSLRFGRPASQLQLVPDILAQVPIMFLAPTLEELGWRGYGVDALRAKLGMRAAAWTFALLWAIWHVPLFFIDHTYQHDLWLESPLYVANFFASVFPAAILANWLYEKHRRFIPAAILFHFMLDAVAESFAIEQFTKCIVTGVFIAVAALIMLLDRKAFAEGPRTFVAADRA